MAWVHSLFVPRRRSQADSCHWQDTSMWAGPLVLGVERARVPGLELIQACLPLRCKGAAQRGERNGRRDIQG